MRVQVQLERTPAPRSLLPVQNLGMSRTVPSISTDDADYLAMLLRRDSRSSEEKQMNPRGSVPQGSGSSGTPPRGSGRSVSTRTPPPGESSLVRNGDVNAEPSDHPSNPMDLRDFVNLGDPENPMDLSAFSDPVAGADVNSFSTKGRGKVWDIEAIPSLV